MRPEQLPEINLLPKYERQSASLLYWFIAIIIIILLAYIFIGYYYFTSKNELEKLETELANKTTEVETLQTQLDRLTEVSQTSLEDSVLFAENYEIPTSLFITEIIDYLGPNSYLAEYRYSNQFAEIITHFETLDEIADYTTDLTASDYIRDTKVDQIETFELDEEQENIVEFDIISRFEVQHSLQLHKQNLKEGTDADE